MKHNLNPSTMLHLALTQGGFTLNALTGEPAEGGYMMGLFPNDDYRTAVIPQAESLHACELEDFIDRWADYNEDLLSIPGNFAGGWLKDGTLYLDVSRQFATKALAIASGKKTEQLAGFDLNTFTEFKI